MSDAKLLVDDLSNKSLTMVINTMKECRKELSEEYVLLWHYTCGRSLHLIFKGGQGLLVSKVGYKNGGWFFSERSPAGLLKESSEDYSKVWGRVHEHVLKINYGNDVSGREAKADFALAVKVPVHILDEEYVPDRSFARFIPKTTFPCGYFPLAFITHVFKLNPNAAVPEINSFAELFFVGEKAKYLHDNSLVDCRIEEAGEYDGNMVYNIAAVVDGAELCIGRVPGQRLRKVVCKDNPHAKLLGPVLWRRQHRGGCVCIQTSDLVDKTCLFVVSTAPSWCGPCRANVKFLKEFHAEARKNNCEIILCSREDTLTEHNRWVLSEDFLTLPFNAEFKQKFNSPGIPWAHCIGADGKIIPINGRLSANSFQVLNAVQEYGGLSQFLKKVGASRRYQELHCQGLAEERERKRAAARQKEMEAVASKQVETNAREEKQRLACERESQRAEERQREMRMAAEEKSVADQQATPKKQPTSGAETTPEKVEKSIAYQQAKAKKEPTNGAETTRKKAEFEMNALLREAQEALAATKAKLEQELKDACKAMDGIRIVQLKKQYEQLLTEIGPDGGTSTFADNDSRGSSDCLSEADASEASHEEEPEEEQDINSGVEDESSSNAVQSESTLIQTVVNTEPDLESEEKPVGSNARWVWCCPRCDEENKIARKCCNMCGVRTASAKWMWYCLVCDAANKPHREKCLDCCTERGPLPSDLAQ